MAATTTARAKTSKPKAPVNQKTLKRKRGDDNTKSLQQRVAGLDVAAEFTTFSDLPLSEPTLRGLEGSHFRTLTDIQGKAIPAAIKGQDILGAAKTGSGKTLAFIVPLLEILYRKRWTEFDGLGALVLSPTRELAIQIFDVLRKVGRHHAFSAGLVIGGKSLKEERERLGKMNILICTPGRMLQHLDQTAELQIENLAVLVLDEADRIMDMGFKSTVDAIVEHLPRTRQTLLFSATQTKKVSDLARLSLQDPYYVSVHETASTATPAKLQQNYIVTPLPEKLDTLWSFIRANTKSKILVFLSSGKQVRFVFETFRHMQPGIPLMHLHGRQKQTARLDITSKFSKTKNACLLATDVVARGLDFAAVDWVIQLDCPEDSDTYIHRVGRTARYEREGRAVLFLCPSEEEGMLKRLKQKNVPIEMIKVKAKKQQSISNQLQNMCFQDPEIKYLAQKAFVSYARSIYVQKDKDVFRLSALPLEEFAASIGLPGAPRIKFQQGEDVKKFKNAPRFLDMSSSDEEEGPKQVEKPRTKYDRMFERQNQNILSNHYSKLMGDESTPADTGADDADEDDGFLSVKQRLDLSSPDGVSSGDEDASEAELDGQDGNGNKEDSRVVIDSNRKQKMLKSKKAMLKFKDRNHKIVYDSDGNAHEVYELEDEDDFRRRGTAADQRAQFIENEALRVREADLDDKETVKAKRRAKQEKRKAREREMASNPEGDEEDEGVTLEPYNEPGSDDQGSMGDLEDRDPGTRKWFQHDPDVEDARRQKKRKPMLEDVGTLEELENLAGQLI